MSTANTHVVITQDQAAVLYSYETPVAAYDGNTYYITDKFHSHTTSRHINKWTQEHPSHPGISKPQEFFDQWVATGKRPVPAPAKQDTDQVKVSLGGVVILITEPYKETWAGTPYTTRGVWDRKKFVDALDEIPGLKEVDGPNINGVIAVTFEYPDGLSLVPWLELKKEQVRLVWERFAE